MASARVISQFTIDSTNKAIVLDAGAGDVTATLAEGSYYWSLDDEDDDFAKALKTALDAATSKTFTVNIVGVDVTNPTMSDGRIKLSVSSGDFTIKLDAGATTIDPRILGYSSESSNPSSASSLLYSTYNHRYGYYPQVAVYDAGAPRATVTASQETTTGGYIDTVFWVSLDSARWRFEYVAAALASEANCEGTRATRALLNEEDPNAPFDIFYGDLIEGGRPWRFYIYQTEYGDEDYDGPYNLVLGSGTQHDTLATANRPMPGAADLFNIELPGLAVPS